MTNREQDRPHRTAQGIACILASVVTMAFAGALVKLASASLTLWQVFAARSLVAVAILVTVLFVAGISGQITPRVLMEAMASFTRASAPKQSARSRR